MKRIKFSASGAAYRVFCMGVFLLAAFSVFAQKDAKAKEILDKSSALFNTSDGISAQFTFTIKDETANLNESFDGEIFLKGTKFFVDTPERTICFDGKTQWVYEKKLEEISIMKSNAQDVQIFNPASFFELYKKGCDYKYKGAKTDNKMRKVQEISLLPKDKKSDFSRIDMQIATSDFMPVFFHLFYKNKLENNIYIHKYELKLEIPDSRFVFDMKKYPQAEVIDLR
jgi:outer membrane lipoprotein-sorting protein